MSVSLVRVEAPGGDGGGEDRLPGNLDVEVTLPMVLGRGSVLKCGDKKVSRRHAYLDWEDTGVLITAVHQSPTFVMVGCGALQEINEGTSVLLSHGDKFGFLKEKFWYMVKLPTTLIGEEKTSTSSSGKGEEEERNGEKKKEEEERTGEKKMEEGRNGEEIKEEKERIKKEESTGENKNNDEERTDEKKNLEEERKEEEEKEKNEKGTEKSNSNLRDTMGTGNRRWGEGMHEAVNGDTTTTTTTTTTEEEREDECMVELTPEQSGVKSDEDSTRKENNLAPSSTSPPSTNTVMRENMSSNINTRHRNLPSWLQHPSRGTPTPAVPTPPATPRGRKKQSKPRTTSPNTIHTSPAPPQGDEELFNLNTASTRKRKENPQEDRTSNRKTKKTPQHPQNTSSPLKGGGGGAHHQMSDDSDGEDTTNTTTPITTTTTTITTTTTPTPSPPHTTTTLTPPASDQKEEEKVEGGGRSSDQPRRAFPTAARPLSPATATTARRPSCQYGANCYRKNPSHKQQEAHPGDPDYRVPDDDGDGDDRPECEFGVDCYRRNPQHRKDFKHSRFPQPQRKAKRKARQQKGKATGGEGEGSEDDYDFDDPFLNDESSDDYAPTDGSSDSAPEPSQDVVEEEDTGRMLKEARKFVKKRK